MITILIFGLLIFVYGWQHLLYYLLHIQHRNSTVLMLGSSSRWWQCGGLSSDCRGPQKLDTPLRSLLHHSRFKLRKVFNLDEAFKLFYKFYKFFTHVCSASRFREAYVRV